MSLRQPLQDICWAQTETFPAHHGSSSYPASRGLFSLSSPFFTASAGEDACWTEGQVDACQACSV